MKNKNILKTIIVLSLFFTIIPIVRAESVSDRIARERVERGASSAASQAEAAATVARLAKERVTRAASSVALLAEAKNKMAGLKKDLAYKEIDRRISSMKKMILKITTIKRLTPLQKSSLISQVNAEIVRLTTLRKKIENDTDATILKADKKLIVSSYRIYALFMPKMTIIAHANAVLDLVDMMLLKKPTDEALAKINLAKTYAEEAIATVINLTPEGYPNNKTELQSAKKSLQTARLNLTGARPLMK